VDACSKTAKRADGTAREPEELLAESSGNSAQAVRRYQLPGLRAGLAAVVAAAALGLVACGGSASTPQVASLGKGHGSSSGSGGSAESTGSANPTQLLDEWAVCIRKHGDPNQTDPTIDADKDIEISMLDVPESLSSEVHAGGGPCSNYLDAASLALNGGQPQPGNNPVQNEKFAQCMRANGFPTWPESTGSDPNFQGTGINPDSPAVDSASNKCGKQVGYPSPSSVGGTIQVTSCTAPPGKQCPPGGPGAGSGGNRPRPVTSLPVGSGANG
jgi:hypothetical protein